MQLSSSSMEQGRINKQSSSSSLGEGICAGNFLIIWKGKFVVILSGGLPFFTYKSSS